MPKDTTITKEEFQDADQMIGAGYSHPSIEIELPRSAIVRRGERMVEEEKSAFVKIYTKFKDDGDLKKIDPIALKVWLFLALSINRNTGNAHPGLRTISDGTGFALNTVRAAIERLENLYHLIVVHRGEKQYNIYEPLDFVSANRQNPPETVSADDTVEKKSVSPAADTDGQRSVSVESGSVSVESGSVSPRVILNQINQNNQNTRAEPEAGNPKKPDLLDGMILFAQKASEKNLYPFREKFPEQLLPLADEYVRTTGEKPNKSKLSLWIAELSDWLSEGVTPADIVAAWSYSRNKYPIMSIKGMTKTVTFIARRRIAAGHSSAKVEVDAGGGTYAA